MIQDRGKGEEELPVVGTIVPLRTAWGPLMVQATDQTPELDKERFSTAAELNCTPRAALHPSPNRNNLRLGNGLRPSLGVRVFIVPFASAGCETYFLSPTIPTGGCYTVRGRVKGW